MDKESLYRECSEKNAYVFSPPPLTSPFVSPLPFSLSLALSLSPFLFISPLFSISPFLSRSLSLVYVYPYFNYVGPGRKIITDPDQQHTVS